MYTFRAILTSAALVLLLPVMFTMALITGIVTTAIYPLLPVCGFMFPDTGIPRCAITRLPSLIIEATDVESHLTSSPVSGCFLYEDEKKIEKVQIRYIL